MTVREKVEAESKVEKEGPGGHVMFIEDLRKCLGTGTPNCETPASSKASPSMGPTRPDGEVILVGHDLRSDFPKMRAEGIKFDPYLHYVGCFDTHVIIEDTCEQHFPKSLGGLMEHYGLAKGKIVKPQNVSPSRAKFVFFGGHNAGNDAIATLKVAVAQALDSKITRKSKKGSKDENDLTDESLSKPLKCMNKGMFLLAYDTEGVESNRYDRQKTLMKPATTEHGFAWLNLAEIAGVPPGKNGTNWHPYIRARHWLNWEYRKFANFKYVVGNPLGFWKEFGKTQYYHKSDGPAPFHQLFRELANAVVVKESSGVTDIATGEVIVTVEEITKSLEKTTIEEIPAVFEGNPVDIMGETPTFRGRPQNHRGKRTSKTGKTPNLRGNIAGGREDMANRRGNRPNSSSNVASSEGFLPNPKGQTLSDGGIAPTNKGNEPKFHDSMAPGEANTPTSKGINPSFNNSIASGGEDTSMYRGKRPNFDDSVTSNGGNAVKDKGNKAILGNNLASGGGNVLTKTGNRPSWAQIVARDTPSGASK